MSNFTYEDSVEINDQDQTAKLQSGGYPGFYFSSNAPAPQGAPWLTDDGLIARRNVAPARSYTGWTHANFDQASVHGAVLLELDIPSAKLTHPKNEEIHWVLPILTFYPLIKTWTGESDIKAIDFGADRMKLRGYTRPGQRAGIAYGWRDTEFQGKKSKQSYVGSLVVPRFMLRGTEGMYADNDGIAPKDMQALPFHIGDKGQKGTEYFFKALCDGQMLATRLMTERKALYEYWTNFYNDSGMDLAEVTKCRDFIESLAARGMKNLPPCWVAHTIGASPEQYPVGSGDNATQFGKKYGTWSFNNATDSTLDELLARVAMPYEIELLTPLVAEGIRWSEGASTISTPKSDKAI